MRPSRRLSSSITPLPWSVSTKPVSKKSSFFAFYLLSCWWRWPDFCGIKIHRQLGLVGLSMFNLKIQGIWQTLHPGTTSSHPGPAGWDYGSNGDIWSLRGQRAPLPLREGEETDGQMVLVQKLAGWWQPEEVTTQWLRKAGDQGSCWNWQKWSARSTEDSK